MDVSRDPIFKDSLSLFATLWVGKLRLNDGPIWVGIPTTPKTIKEG